MMLTVFTPTYNRGDYLHRVYQSLLKQKDADFEWLIIDDGSQDDTAEIVEAFLQEQKIQIRYFRKENGGKHTAYNYALEVACGDWFMCLDADDILHDDAISHIHKIAIECTPLTGIIAYKQDVRGKRLSDCFPANVTQCKVSDLFLRFQCKGEFTLIYPTKLAAQYKFPVFPRERFVGESVVYDRLDEVCSMVLLPQIITVCEYLEDGYSNNFSKLLKNNPNGFCVYFLQRIDLQRKLLPRLIHAGKYWSFRWISGNRELSYQGKYRLLVALAAIPGAMFRIYYKLFRGI